MRTHQRISWLAVALALVVPLAIVIALVPLRRQIDNANVALLLAVGVVVVAMLGRRVAVFVAAGSAMAWFDFFHTRPYQSFTIDNRDDLVTAAVLLVVGIMVGELAIRARRHRHTAEVRKAEIDRLHTIAAMVTAGESAADIIMVVATELRDLLGLRDCMYEPVPRGEDVPRNVTLERDGTVVMGELGWDAAATGLPGTRVDLRVYARGEIIGLFVLVPTPAEPVSLEQRIVATALADQVGSAVALASSPTHHAG